MFKWKVYVYRNNNWKEEEFEKEFDNPQEFYNFRKTYRQPEFEGPFMWLGDWANLQNYFNNFVNTQTFISQIYHSNNENSNKKNDEIKLWNNENENNSFLRRKSNNYLIEEEINKKNNDKVYLKREKNEMKKDKQLNCKNKINNIDNKENSSGEINFSDILKMSINEKKIIDKSEREQKKLNKIQLMKIQKRNRLIGNDQKMEIN